MEKTELSILFKYLACIKDKNLIVTPEQITLISGKEEIFRINNKLITLAQKTELNSRLSTHRNVGKNFSKYAEFQDFLKDLGKSLIRLNHLGISYLCEDFPMEIDTHKKAIANTDLKIYEEHSGSKISRWLFLGNTENWQNPLFELVLNNKVTTPLKKWVPHFQIDLDTDLSIEELESIVNRHFGEKFFGWKLNIPNYGVVLAMGMLEEINGIKIYLGLGTKLRNTKYHREVLLKPLK